MILVFSYGTIDSQGKKALLCLKTIPWVDCPRTNERSHQPKRAHLRTEGKDLNLTKSIYKKPTVSIPRGEKLETFPLRLGIRQRCLLSPLLLNVTIKGVKKLCLCTAAAAAKSLQSCPTLCDPIDGSPPGSPVPGILQARTLEWVAMAFSNA